MISAVIITYNEQHNIRRCIESIMTVVDEIIVVDSFSTDKTKDICKEFNVRFFSKEWEGYSETKNFGNQQCKYEYILSLDADEALSEELTNSILSVKENLNGAYKFNRLTNYSGKWIYHCGWYPDVKIRLFPKNKSYWVGDYVHEILETDKDVSITPLKGNLLHFAYRNKKEHLEKIKKYSSLHAEKMFAENIKFNPLKLIVAPAIKFIMDYFIHKGFLDGKAGFTICRISAKAVFLKYLKLKKLTKR